MQLKSILNRVQLHRGFVYGNARWREQARSHCPCYRDSPSQGKPAALLCLRAQGSWLRCSCTSAFRVRPAVGHCRFLPLRHAPGPMPSLRCEGREGSVGSREESSDDHLCLVPGSLGQAPVLERGCRGFPNLLGQRLSIRENGRRLGAGAPQSGSCYMLPPSVSTRSPGKKGINI